MGPTSKGAEGKGRGGKVERRKGRGGEGKGEPPLFVKVYAPAWRQERKQWLLNHREGMRTFNKRYSNVCDIVWKSLYVNDMLTLFCSLILRFINVCMQTFTNKPFLCASAMLKHVIDIGWTSVRLSVRPSHASTVSKGLNILSCFLHHTIAHLF